MTYPNLIYYWWPTLTLSIIDNQPWPYPLLVTNTNPIYYWWPTLTLSIIDNQP